MLLAAFGLLSLAVLAGLGLIALHARPRRPHWAIGAAHGTVGATGLAVLVAAAATGAPHGAAAGAGGFDWTASALLGLALLAGLAIPLTAWRARGLTGLALALHASIAIIGYVILIAYVSV
jgi:hypothetical protein